MLFEVLVVQRSTIEGSKGITIGDHRTSTMQTNHKTLQYEKASLIKLGTKELGSVNQSCDLLEGGHKFKTWHNQYSKEEFSP